MSSDSHHLPVPAMATASPAWIVPVLLALAALCAAAEAEARWMEEEELWPAASTVMASTMATVVS